MRRRRNNKQERIHPERGYGGAMTGAWLVLSASLWLSQSLIGAERVDGYIYNRSFSAEVYPDGGVGSQFENLPAPTGDIVYEVHYTPGTTLNIEIREVAVTLSGGPRDIVVRTDTAGAYPLGSSSPDHFSKGAARDIQFPWTFSGPVTADKWNWDVDGPVVDFDLELGMIVELWGDDGTGLTLRDSVYVRGTTEYKLRRTAVDPGPGVELNLEVPIHKIHLFCDGFFGENRPGTKEEDDDDCLEPGGINTRLSSLDLSLGLGRDSDGDGVGVISLRAGSIIDEVWSPSALDVSPGPDFFAVDNGTEPIQFVGPHFLADVVDPTAGDNSYEIHFFRRDVDGTPDPQTGAYPAEGAAFTKVTISDEGSTGAVSAFRIERTSGLDTLAPTKKAFLYENTTATGQWERVFHSGKRKEKLVEYTETRNVLNPDGSNKLDGGGNPITYTAEIEERQMLDASGDLVTAVRRVYRTMPWDAREIVEMVVNPDDNSSDPTLRDRNLTTRYFYDEDDGGPTDYDYSQLTLVIRDDGDWESFSGYDDEERYAIQTRPFGDTAFDATNAGLVEVTEFEYFTVSTLPAVGITQKLVDLDPAGASDVEISHSYSIDTPDGYKRIICQNPGDDHLTSSNLVTQSAKYTDGTERGELKYIRFPDGTITTFAYSTDGVTGNRTTDSHSGVEGALGGGGVPTVTDGRRTVVVENPEGEVIGVTVTDIVSGIVIEKSTVTKTDRLGRPLATLHLDGQVTEARYGCCGLESTTDRRGVTTFYTENDLVFTTSRLGVVVTSEEEEEARGGGGRILKSTRMGTDQSSTALFERHYNAANQLILEEDAVGRQTTYSESLNTTSGHVIRTTTDNIGKTVVREFSKDGRLLKVTGTGTHHRRYEYGADVDGTFSKEILLLANGNDSMEWSTTYTDFSGRPSKTVRSYDETSQAVTALHYNDKGQLERTVDPEGMTRLFAYNAIGERETSAVDFDGNNAIDYGGTDRITRTRSFYTTRDEFDVRRTVTEVWTTSGNAEAVETASMTDASVDGLRRWLISDGRTTSSVTEYSSDGNYTIDLLFPDQSSRQQVFIAGRLKSDSMVDAAGEQIKAATYEYDAFGRLKESNDARNGVTAYTYYDDDRIHLLKKPDPDGAGPGQVQTTAYEYDGLGRREKVYLPGDATQSVTYAYADTGELNSMSGFRVYSAVYTYDYAGRLETLVYGNGTTTWDYDPYSGYLESKEYHDNKKTQYVYDKAGRPKDRIWTRLVETDYTYTPDGLLSSVVYSDATPSVGFGYDRMGNLTSMTDAAGTRTFEVSPDGRLLSESISGGLLDGAFINCVHDNLKRRQTLSASFSGEGVTHGFRYDGASRLEKVSVGPDPSAAASATYAYQSNSNLLDTITFRDAGQTTRLTTNYSYDFLERLTSISSTSVGGSSPLSQSFTYAYDGGNRRERVDLADGSYWIYDYDDLGQVTGATKYLSGGAVVPGQSFVYGYDSAGNRTTTTRGDGGSPLSTVTYVPDVLNQYDSRSEQGTYWITGEADPAATVTIEGVVTATRPGGGRFFTTPFGAALGGGDAADPSDVLVESALGGNTDSESRWLFVDPPNVTYSYDDDGNLESDERWDYTWDAENRLIEAEARWTGAANVPHLRLSFDYDGLGRRISKRVEEKVGSEWILASERRFLYDGWNLVAEYERKDDEGFQLKRSYLWGLDLSGSRTNAGGVGGLLGVTVHSSSGSPATHFASYDGNGNLVGLVDSSNGDQSGEYEYDVFGGTLRIVGEAAGINPFRFSTKYWDGELGQYYYSYRYYDPVTGRWSSRDPMGERASENLYRALRNDLFNDADYLGLDSWKEKVDSFWAAVFDPFTNDSVTNTNEKIGRPTITEQFLDNGDFLGVSDRLESNIEKTIESGRQMLETAEYGLEFVNPIPSEAIVVAVAGGWVIIKVGGKIISMFKKKKKRSEDDLLSEAFGGERCDPDYVGGEFLDDGVPNRLDPVPRPKKFEDFGDRPFFNKTDKMDREDLTDLFDSVYEKGFENPIIEYIEAGGERYIVRGNNRYTVAQMQSRVHELLFQEVELPLEGTNWKTVDEVITAAVELYLPSAY